MNRISAIALVIAASAAGSAFADDITVETMPFTSSLTRAQVMAELDAFRSSGIDPWSKTYEPLAAMTSERARVDVTAEYIAARAQVAAFHGEDSGSMLLARGHMAAPASSVAALPVTTE